LLGWRGATAGLRELAPHEVLVAPYISEAMGTRLRAQSTCYLDRVGNAWLTEGTHLTAVLVQGRAKPREVRAAGSLLLGKMGLHLLPHLLTEPRLVELVELRHRWVAAYGETVRPKLAALQWPAAAAAIGAGLVAAGGESAGATG
jgi:hypothetical protein